MFKRLSQTFNVILVGSFAAFLLASPEIGSAQSTADRTAIAGKLDGRLPAPPLRFAQATNLPATPTTTAPAPSVEGKPDAVVPPLVRKKPAPAPTSVPIVAGKATKKAPPAVAGGGAATRATIKPVVKPAGTAKPQPAAAQKSPAPVGRSSLGGPLPAAACAAGMRYESRLLKCVKSLAPRVAPAAARAPAAKGRPSGAAAKQ